VDRIVQIKSNRANSLADVGEWVLIIAFVVFFSALALTKHAAFETHGFDLGNYDQTVWNTLHGRFLACTNWPPFGESRLAFHVEPLLVLIAPLYLLHAGPETLLVLQAVVVGLGAWPVAKIARHRLDKPWTGPLFAAVYLLFPALEAGPTFEFHAVTLAATLLAMALYAIEIERYGLSVPWLILAASCKEEIPLLVAMVGLYLVFMRRRYKLGLAVTLASLGWFLVCVQIILPHFNSQDESAHLGRYSYLGGSVLDIGKTVVTHPQLVWDKLREPARFAYLWRIPLPTGYLALLAPEILLLALPTIAINVLSMFSPMYALDFVHYSVPLVPFVVIAAIHGLERVWTLSRRLFRRVDSSFLLLLFAGYLIFTSLFYHRIFGHTPLAGTFRWPQVTKHDRIGWEVLKEIPSEAAVSAQMSLNPHLSQRERAFVFPHYEHSDYVALDVTALGDNELSLSPALINNRSGSYHHNPALSQTDYLTLVRSLLDDPQWGVFQARDGYLVLQRGAPEESPGEAFYTPFLSCGDAEMLPVEVSFGDTLILSGLTVEPGPRAGHVLHTYWQGGQRTANGFRVYLALVDASVSPARVIRARELTASVLVPSSMWLSGQEIHDRARILFPGESDRYQLALMVGSEDAEQQAEQRLSVSVEPDVDRISVDAAARLLMLDSPNDQWRLED